MVKLLYSHGVNINQADNGGIDPFYWTCQYGHLEVVKLLVGYGVNIHQVYEGETPLQVAERNNQIEVVEFLRDPFALV